MIGQYIALLHLVTRVPIAMDCPSNADASRYPVKPRWISAVFRFSTTKKDAGWYSGRLSTLRRSFSFTTYLYVGASAGRCVQVARRNRSADAQSIDRRRKC
jgi:hypothetical protein